MMLKSRRAGLLVHTINHQQFRHNIKAVMKQCMRLQPCKFEVKFAQSTDRYPLKKIENAS